ncbi:MAG: hypothetical protein RBR87_01385 [Bacteroidales bacterium]|nr:hypothetical protein [Bacteroidales bacterium]
MIQYHHVSTRNRAVAPGRPDDQFAAQVLNPSLHNQSLLYHRVGLPRESLFVSANPKNKGKLAPVVN